MKPWDREAALSAAAIGSGGVVRNTALPPASTAHLRSNSHSRDNDDEEDDTAATAAGGNGGGVGGEERFSGVSSLISRWQQNVESNAPGWGRIGTNSDRREGDKAGLGPGLGPKVANAAAGVVRDRYQK